jgi:DNA-binding PadR family transcriptional regulator
MFRRRQTIDAVAPLGASAFEILLALADGERHGSSISSEVDAATSGRIRLMPGALYRYLKQMAADGWIADTVKVGDDDARRRYYRLTALGRRVAQAEAERLEEVVRVARLRRLLPSLAKVKA